MTAEATDLISVPTLSRPRPHVDLVPRLPVRRLATWQVGYLTALVILDSVAFLAAGLLAVVVRFGELEVPLVGPTSYWASVILALPLWVLAMAFSRGYSIHLVGRGAMEHRRVVDASVRFAAVLGLVVLAAHVNIARWVVVIGVPTAGILSILLRRAARQYLARARALGRAMHSVLVIGDQDTAFSLAARLASDPRQGYLVAGVCVPEGSDRRKASGRTHQVVDRRRRRAEHPVLGDLEDVSRLVRDSMIDMIAAAPAAGLTAQRLRQLAWDVEGWGVEMLVAPALTDVAGPRIHVTPVEGQPLLHIRTPQLNGPSTVVKAAFDRTLALVVLVLVSPVLLAVAVAVRATSSGPALFRQVRVGQGGRPFTILKFRTMHTDADNRLASLWEQNAHQGGPLFKMADDPRLTLIGGFLRRWSLDELPQLVNVLLGQMSLVGPRPPVPREVDEYERGHVFRRLMVKPGLTGLWQVSGRSDLDWSESVRLDLYYVENWSLALDTAILGRTAGAVLRGRGAY